MANGVGVLRTLLHRGPCRPAFVARRKFRTLSPWKSALAAGARGGFHPHALPQHSYLRGLGPTFGGKVVAGLFLPTPAPPALAERDKFCSRRGQKGAGNVG